MPANPNFDLTTVGAVKSWLSSNGQPSSTTTDDGNIQALISAGSSYWLWRTGRSNSDGSIPSQSPLVQQISYNEWYDGNGALRMFIRITPIVSVQTLTVNGVSIPQSSGPNVAGFVIDQSGRSIAMRSVPASTLGRVPWPTPYARCNGFIYNFAEGIQNVNVQYTAGFNGTPPDIEIACRQMVALTYQRKQRRDQTSQAMAAGAGTISFKTDWVIPPEVEQVIQHYTRRAIV